ncbi:hypothetical protein [Mariniblastus fucicola]|nr:hypothetical protein [Mariniblastus fucicola]
METFHLHSSSGPWPNCVTARVRFRGPIDVAVARQAWLHCVARQRHAVWPIESLNGWPKWSTGDAEERLGELAEASFHDVEFDRLPDREIDLELPFMNDRGLPKVEATDRAGFGLWCVRCKSNDDVTLIFAADHALADGAAAITFIRDWMLVYHNLVAENEIDRGLVKLDWQRWKSRSHLGLFRWSFLKFLPCQAIGLFGATKFIFRKFSTIEAADSTVSTSETRSPGIIGSDVSPQLLAELNDRADRLGVSTNSLLMTALFRAMKRVRSSLESGTSTRSFWSERKWIRLVLPISIRGVADRKLPCANRASLVQIERTFEQVANADAAAQTIDREVRIIMGFKLDHVFLIAIRMISVVPVALRFVARNQKSRGTAVFTNLGEPFRKTRACNFREVGNLEVKDYDLCGPVRCGTPVNFSWSTFRKRVGSEMQTHGRISLHFDRAIVDDRTADMMQQAFAKELQDVAQFGGSTR